MQPHVNQAEQASRLVAALVCSGLRTLIISPGARSSPLAAAALDQPRLETVAVIDERNAAFFALGRGKATGRASALLCTSGSAVTHSLPAAIEAHHSHTPLLVLSADRPAALHACGAPQTIEQRHILGFAAAFFADLDLADPHLSPAVLRRYAVQAWTATRAPYGGASHLNIRCHEPLLADVDELGQPSAATSLPDADPPHAPLIRHFPAEPRAPAEAWRAWQECTQQAALRLILIGPCAPWRSIDRNCLAELAERCDAWIYAEATSQLRFGPSGCALHRRSLPSLPWMPWLEPAARLRRASILQLGPAPWALRLIKEKLQAWQLSYWVAAHSAWQVPDSQADAVIDCPPEKLIADWAARAHRGPSWPRGALSPWLMEQRQALDETAEDASRTPLQISDKSEWTSAEHERRLVGAFVAALPKHTRLVIGNSLAVRHLDRSVDASRTPMEVISQRGTNGIDGTVALAAGAADVQLPAAAALIGDVTLAHNLGALPLLSKAAPPLLLAVINNGGGRIFDGLPLARTRLYQSCAQYWTTPPGIDLGAVARAHGLRFRSVSTTEQVKQAVEAHVAAPSSTLLELSAAGLRPASGRPSPQ